MTITPSSPLDAARSGVYRTPAASDLLRQAAARVGIAYFAIDLKGVRGKSGFLDACAAALHFPEPFGRNWDAFADCVQDLSWQSARGYVIHLQHASGFAATAPLDYATAIEILAYASEYWKGRGTAFIVLVDDATGLAVFPE